MKASKGKAVKHNEASSFRTEPWHSFLMWLDLAVFPDSRNGTQGPQKGVSSEVLTVRVLPAYVSQISNFVAHAQHLGGRVPRILGWRSPAVFFWNSRGPFSLIDGTLQR